MSGCIYVNDMTSSGVVLEDRLTDPEVATLLELLIENHHGGDGRYRGCEGCVLVNEILRLRGRNGPNRQTTTAP
jgi:hypothetical protein